MKKIEHIYNILLKNLNIKNASIIPIGGMTNANYKIMSETNSYVLRIPGEGIKDLISRKNEYFNMQQIQNLGLDATLFYFDEKSGVKITKYIENAETLNPKTAWIYRKKVADILRRFHSSDICFINTFDVFREILRYENKIQSKIEEKLENYGEIRKKVFLLQEELDKMGRKLTACHNDTVAENFVLGKEKIYLIDWEYSGMNELEWDLAAFSLENQFDQEQTKEFLEIYFEGKITEENRKKILIYQICQDFLWTLWTVLKEEHGENFGDYGKIRYQRALHLLEVMEYEYRN